MFYMMDTIGWTGTILLAFCGIPQLIKSIREGHSDGMSWVFLLTWFIGEICLLIFTVGKMKGIILIMNYVLNIIIVGGILRYKMFPKREEADENPDN